MRMGERCRLLARMSHAQAAPLRRRRALVLRAPHEPDTALAGVTRCAATCADGESCKLTSACSFVTARPLREGG
eukprot:208695-Prymnesium_polylepis.1